MRVIDYSRHLNKKQWTELAFQLKTSPAHVALMDVGTVRKQVKRWMGSKERGHYFYRFYRELLRALGGHGWHGPP